MVLEVALDELHKIASAVDDHSEDREILGSESSEHRGGAHGCP